MHGKLSHLLPHFTSELSMLNTLKLAAFWSDPSCAHQLQESFFGQMQDTPAWTIVNNKLDPYKFFLYHSQNRGPEVVGIMATPEKEAVGMPLSTPSS